MPRKCCAAQYNAAPTAIPPNVTRTEPSSYLGSDHHKNAKPINASVPTDNTPCVEADMPADPPASTPNPCSAAVTGPCGLAFADVPCTPGHAAS
jgi:hypothetical protein